MPPAGKKGKKKGGGMEVKSVKLALQKRKVKKKITGGQA